MTKAAHRKLWMTLAWLVPMTLGAMVFIDVTSVSTNCGGNSRALWVCPEFVSLWSSPTAILAAKAGDGTLSFEQLRKVISPEDVAAATGALDLAREYIVAQPALRVPRVPREPVIVCTTRYSNVPQPTVWLLYRRNPAHAVGYSDGTVDLITPAEFEALDFSRFGAADSEGFGE